MQLFSNKKINVKNNNQIIQKEQIAFYCSLALFFSYVELFLPRVFPFFKFGFANIAILLALNLPFSSFFVLSVLKAVCVCCINGTLFTPFFLVSIVQSVVSANFMFLLYKTLYKLKNAKFISLYGISVFGSVVSSICQLVLFSLYLNRNIIIFLGPMLLFSVVSGLLTAGVSYYLIDDSFTISNHSINLEETKHDKYLVLKLILLLFFMILVFMSKNIYFLLSCLIISFVLQKVSKRKILILLHFYMWLFVIITCLFIPEGKVLFEYKFIAITKGALLEGVQKALKLSTVMAISQIIATFNFVTKNSIFYMIFAYNNVLINNFKKTKGNLLQRVKNCLI